MFDRENSTFTEKELVSAVIEAIWRLVGLEPERAQPVARYAASGHSNALKASAC